MSRKVAKKNVCVQVTNKKHEYLQHIEHREEGGTPEILGSIRAGLVFQLKAAVGASRIEMLEREHIKYVLSELGKTDSVQVLGSSTVPRVGILSFNILLPVEFRRRNRHCVDNPAHIQ